MVKTVVKQALTRKMGNTAREKVLEPQGKIVSRANRSSTLSKTPKAGALPAALHPDIGCIIQEDSEKSNRKIPGLEKRLTDHPLCGRIQPQFHRTVRNHPVGK